MVPESQVPKPWNFLNDNSNRSIFKIFDFWSSFISRKQSHKGEMSVLSFMGQAPFHLNCVYVNEVTFGRQL